ncbi:MAG: hypothetical protein OJF49_001917 [Ktedonobacterales bacterium]|nr:MAG: hypothetical protein OJF49_001917 [Ktedonobacterales bacterium]
MAYRSATGFARYGKAANWYGWRPCAEKRLRDIRTHTTVALYC